MTKKSMRRNVKRALRQVAKSQGISVKEVYASIQEMIDTARANPDPRIQAEWNNIPCSYGTPGPEDLIQYVVNKLERSRIGK